MIVCSNRIDAMSQAAVDQATKGKDYQRLAYSKALAGVRTARAGIAANNSMGVEAKREALASMDESIRELQADMAKDD